jgi:uncharacterized membrane protein
MASETRSIRTIARWTLGGTLVVAGTGHLTSQREEFRAQVPEWMPIDDDPVVLASGVVEITLGLAIILLRRQRAAVGLVVAGFFVVIFPTQVPQPAGNTGHRRSPTVKVVGPCGEETRRSQHVSPGWECGASWNRTSDLTLIRGAL